MKKKENSGKEEKSEKRKMSKETIKELPNGVEYGKGKKVWSGYIVYIENENKCSINLRLFAFLEKQRIF